MKDTQKEIKYLCTLAHTDDCIRNYNYADCNYGVEESSFPELKISSDYTRK